MSKNIQLPCSVGDTVYFISGGYICGGRVQVISYCESELDSDKEQNTGNFIRVVFYNGGTQEFSLDDYNKIWYTDYDMATNSINPKNYFNSLKKDNPQEYIRVLERVLEEFAAEVPCDCCPYRIRCLDSGHPDNSYNYDNCVINSLYFANKDLEQEVYNKCNSTIRKS